VTLLGIDEAQAIVLAHARALAAVERPLQDVAADVLARDVLARWDQPLADVSTMDGWAVRADDLMRARAEGRAELALRRVGESAAGRPTARAIAAGETVRISTGAVVPDGADAVVAQEDARDGGEVVHVDLARVGEVARGLFVRPRARDFAAGERLLAAGDRLGPGELALLVAGGHTHVTVHRRPTVALLATGDELVDPGTAPPAGGVPASSSVMLEALVRAAGAEPRSLGRAGDDATVLAGRLRDALASDVVLTTGGVSVGDHDHVAAALAALGCTARWHGVRMRPGKPTWFGTHEDTLVFGLPGNPASTLVAFELFVRPALRRCAGVRGRAARPWVELVAATDMPGAGTREHIVRARIDDGAVWALPDQRSGDLRSVAPCDALVRVPAGIDRIPAGAACRALVLDPSWHERA
jgi:molybdopterin molybdotransferase